jgi:hypothetical protein
MKALPLSVALAIGLLAAGVSGAPDARYLMTGRQLPMPVAANGYVQTVTTGADGIAEVRVATTLSPVGARGMYREVRAGGAGAVPDGFEIPRALEEKLRDHHESWEAATRILEWVVRNVKLDDRPAPQDAASVLHRGWGRCSGLANASAALLLAAGFEARTVSGLLIDGDDVVPHRWLECRLPGAGWVPSDPTLGLWAITPQHVAFSTTVAETPEVSVLDPGRNGLELLPRRRGRPIRPNVGSELVCRLVGREGPARAMAMLYGRNGDVHHAVLDPEGRFESLLPGRWRLVVVADGRVLENRDLELAAAQRHTFSVARSRPRPEREVGW